MLILTQSPLAKHDQEADYDDDFEASGDNESLGGDPFAGFGGENVGIGGSSSSNDGEEIFVRVRLTLVRQWDPRLMDQVREGGNLTARE